MLIWQINQLKTTKTTVTEFTEMVEIYHLSSELILVKKQ